MTNAEQPADTDDLGEDYRPFRSYADGSSGIKSQHALDHIALYLCHIERHLRRIANASDSSAIPQGDCTVTYAPRAIAP